MSTTYIDLLRWAQWTLGRSSNMVGPQQALSGTSYPVQADPRLRQLLPHLSEGSPTPAG